VAKRNRATTSRVIAKRIAEGRGEGAGSSYNPWYHIQDVASKGLVTRVKGWKTKRVQHFLSLLELRYFYLLEWDQNITDIREQYPLLPQEETLTIAESCGIPHPADPKTRYPVVMTTDFLYTMRAGVGEVDRACAVKYASDLQSRRTLEKLEIERRYWKARNIVWNIITERDVTIALAKNIEWVHQYLYLHDFTTLPKPATRQITSVLTQQIHASSASLRDVTSHTDESLGLDAGTSLSMVRHLIARRFWPVDMYQPINPNKRLALLNSQH
jgi:hypothetical protein